MFNGSANNHIHAASKRLMLRSPLLFFFKFRHYCASFYYSFCSFFSLNVCHLKLLPSFSESRPKTTFQIPSQRVLIDFSTLWLPCDIIPFSLALTVVFGEQTHECILDTKQMRLDRSHLAALFRQCQQPNTRGLGKKRN